jgi:anaerobic magnesium-protoporphyrin IX monomethyl ester cyclase
MTPDTVTDPTHNQSVSVLFVILPYTVAANVASSKKGVRSFLAFPYGVLTLASFIRSRCTKAKDIKILDLNCFPHEDMEKALEEALQTHRPNIVAVSMMFDISYSHVGMVCSTVKSFDPSILLLMGGAAATSSYEEILGDHPSIDAICYAEGELAIKNLVDADNFEIELGKDPWVTKKSLAAGIKPQYVYVDHLNDVIDVDYDLIDVKAYSMKEAFSPFASYRHDKDVRQFFIVTSRGCPFKCVFCAEPSFHGNTVRYADVDSIIDHIQHLVTKYGMNVLTIYDDQLLLNRKRAKELFRRLAQFNLRIEMPNGLTAILIDEEIAQLMKDAGVDSVFLAIESGSEFVLKEIIRKPIRLDRVQPIIESLHRVGIFVQAFFINGFPGEREEDRQTTLKFIKEVGVDWSLFNFASPLRGSALYNICKENGWIDEQFLGIGNVDTTEYIIRAPGIDPEHIQNQTYQMNLEVNFVDNYRMRTGDFATAARCFEEVIERHPHHPFAHYFLSKAYASMGKSSEQVQSHMDTFNRIVGDDPSWQIHARHFGLGNF